MSNTCFIGEGAMFCFAPTVATTIAVGNTFTYNQYPQNNTKTEARCGCDREFFIFNDINTDKIWLKKPGRYLFEVVVETTPAVDTVVAIINEANEAKIPLYTGTGGAVSLFVPECGSIVRLKNVGTVPIVLTPGTDLSVPLVILCITYEGPGGV